MFRSISYLLVLTLLYSCGANTYIKDKHKATFSEFQIKPINFGEFEIQPMEREAMENPPKGYQLFGETYKLIENNRNNFVHKVGLTFGIEYKLLCEVDDSIPLNVKWLYPPGMKDIYGNNINEDNLFYNRATNTEVVECYIIESENEMIPGDWTVQVLFDTTILYQKTFRLF